jgi:hypothetical protein
MIREISRKDINKTIVGCFTLAIGARKNRIAIRERLLERPGFQTRCG